MLVLEARDRVLGLTNCQFCLGYKVSESSLPHRGAGSERIQTRN